jgi:hypothetical protein
MNPANRKTWFRRIAFAAFFTGVGAILSLLVFYTWLGTYPDDVDPRNIYYVLWKHGLITTGISIPPWRRCPAMCGPKGGWKG